MSAVPNTKPPISTHILDTTRGQPAAGVDVILIDSNVALHYFSIQFIWFILLGFIVQIY